MADLTSGFTLASRQSRRRRARAGRRRNSMSPVRASGGWWRRRPARPRTGGAVRRPLPTSRAP
eukprot:6736210-Lingulodinium_polyedra.AAC.1